MIAEEVSKERMRRASRIMWFCIIGLIAGVVLCYFYVDEGVRTWVYNHPEALQKGRWLKALEQLGKGWPIIWLMMLWVWMSGQTRTAKKAILSLVIVAVTVIPLKIIAHRPRPREAIGTINQPEEAGKDSRWLHNQSFPSGDTATVFAVSTVLSVFVGWLWIVLFFIISTAVGLLRIASLAHYPSDVCGGAAAGIFCGWLMLRISPLWSQTNLVPDKLYHRTAVVGIFLIPFLIGLFEESDDLLIFIEVYVPMAAGFYVIYKVVSRLKKAEGGGRKTEDRGRDVRGFRPGGGRQ